MIRLFWSVFNSAMYPLIMVLSMWLAYFMNLDFRWHLEELGVRPQDTAGLFGILMMPFLHENLEHLFSNSVPLLVAGSFLFYYFKRLTWLITSVVWLLGGFILWGIGQYGTIHIGASGLVYGLVFFLLFSGIIRGHRNLAAVSLLMVFLYGSFVWGLFPDYSFLLKENISWEGHLGGTICGVVMAFLLRKKGPKKPVENIELEDEDDLDENPYWLADDSEVEEKSKELDPSSALPIKPYPFLPKSANPWE